MWTAEQLFLHTVIGESEGGGQKILTGSRATDSKNDVFFCFTSILEPFWRQFLVDLLSIFRLGMEGTQLQKKCVNVVVFCFMFCVIF